MPPPRRCHATALPLPCHCPIAQPPMHSTTTSPTVKTVTVKTPAALSFGPSSSYAFLFSARRLRRDLIRFGEWVAARRCRLIIDGPNVGYRNQNFEGGRFSFTQVE